MESPVVLDKPPEYHGNAACNERGFPFDEEEGSSAWSELAARHPDIAARLRARPSTWARKRRPSSQDASDDFGGFGEHFDRFPFDDIPPEFREHFPSHWNRRFGPRDEPQPQAQVPHPPSPPSQQQTTSTQTEQGSDPSPREPEQTHLPQYGLRNTVDLGQKSPADPSLVDAEERNQRSMSAPPDSRTPNQNCTNKMSGQQQQQEHPSEHAQSNVRHIPIFVEGRDEPVINKSANHGAHYAEPKPNYAPPPVDREQYFSDESPSFHHPPNFSRAFGAPFSKGFRQNPQPFVQQKVYPQSAFARGNSPLRSQSPKPHNEEAYVKVPVHHEQSAPVKTEHPPSKPQQQHQPPPPPPRQHSPQPQQQQPPQRPQSPPSQKPQTPSANDPITQILSIQTDVLNLMTEVENFIGTKADKKYMFLDEMLTRNLIKLDNIETDGKENIRQARKEAIRCIQKCIAVLEAKADNKSMKPAAAQDVDMIESVTENKENCNTTENGEVEVKEKTKEPKAADETRQQVDGKDNEAETETPDTRPEAEKQTAELNTDSDKSKTSPKKGSKGVKKCDKNKDGAKDKIDKVDVELEKKEMQVDEKGDGKTAQTMEVDGATPASQ